MNKIIQVNLNGQVASNDLLLQFMREEGIAVAAISEPHSVPDDPGWALSLDGTAAITWRGSESSADCRIIASEMGFCAIGWRDLIICSCYFSPNRRLREFVTWLDTMGAVLAPLVGSPMLILGDFNARSLAWDVACNDRGDPLSDWMAGLGFVLLNRGSTPTTFHPRGISVVDTSWANHGASRLVREWAVILDAEVSTDHRPIVIGLSGDTGIVDRRRKTASRLPRWVMARLNSERLEEGALAATWVSIPDNLNAGLYVDRIREILNDICDCAMPRAPVIGRNSRPLYWWNAEIAELRARCVRARRYAWRGRGRVSSEVLADRFAELREAQECQSKSLEGTTGNFGSGPMGKAIQASFQEN